MAWTALGVDCEPVVCMCVFLIPSFVLFCTQPPLHLTNFHFVLPHGAIPSTPPQERLIANMLVALTSHSNTVPVMPL